MSNGVSGIPTAGNLLAGDPQTVARYFARLRASGVQYPGCCERLRAIFRNAGRVEPSDAMIDAWLGEEEEAGASVAVDGVPGRTPAGRVHFPGTGLDPKAKEGVR